ncbi:chloride channel protein, partial [candidate division KSB1 bacterium]
IPDYIKPMLGGLIIGAISLRFPEVLGTGYEAIDLALAGKLTSLVLFSLIFLKLSAVSITLGSGGSGGIFAPSLFLGAMTGGFVGVVFNALFPGIAAPYGAYALVGMGAVVAATTHAPLTAIIILFEMTSDYSIILPLMIACIVATVTAMKLKKESIYSMKLIRKKLNIFVGKELNILKSLYVKSVMTEDVEIVPETANLNSLLEQLVKSNHSSLFMVDENNQFSGIITMHDLRGVFFDRDSLQDLLIARDVAITERITVTPEDDLDHAIKLFGQYNIDEIPVVESRYSRKIIGSVWRNTVMDAYNQEILRRDLIGELSGRIKSTEKSPHIDIADGYSMAEVEVPHRFIGKSIIDAQIRSKYGVEIVLIKRRLSAEETAKLHKNEETLIPDSSYIIREGDILLIVGSKNKINSFKYSG